MKSVKQLLEETGNTDTAHITTGKFEGVHAGHQQVINQVLSQEKGKKQVVVTHTQDHLRGKVFSAQEKIKLLKKAYPNNKTSFVATTPEKPTLFHHLSDLHKQGIKHVHLHLGSDRIGKKETKPDEGTLADNIIKQNGKFNKEKQGYKFKSITFHTVGETRKKEGSGEDLDSASSTKMREIAMHPDLTTADKVNKVHKMMHRNLTKDDAAGYVNTVQDRVLKSRQDSDKKMAGRATARMAKKTKNNEDVVIGLYVSDGIHEGEIINVASNYVTIIAEGEEVKCWIDDLEACEGGNKRDQIYKESFIFKGYKSKNLTRELAEQFRDIAKTTDDVYALLSCLKCVDYILNTDESSIMQDFPKVKVQLERAKRYTNKFSINIMEQLKSIEEGCLKYSILSEQKFLTTDKLMIARMIASVGEVEVSGSAPELIVNKAVMALRLEHLTVPGWKLLGRMLNVATKAGIQWSRSAFSQSQQEIMELA